MSADDPIMVATDYGSVQVGSDVYTFHKDVTRFRASHPAVKSNPHLFKPLDVHYGDDEQATQGPGEKRGKQRDR